MDALLPVGAIGAAAPARADDAAAVARRSAAEGDVAFTEALSRAGHPARLGAAAPASVGEQFEAVTLTTFVSQMLPDGDSTVWGGSAGKMWRGLFAEHLAAEVARSGGIGIADVIDTMMVDRTGDEA